MATAQLDAYNTITLPANADLSSYRYRLAKVNSSGYATYCTSTGERPVGVLINKPAAQGADASVQIGGVGIVEAGGSVTAGDALMTDTVGRAITRTGSNVVIGVALTSGSSGERISVALIPADGVPGGGIEAVSSAGAISPSTYETHLTVSGPVAYTMGDGQFYGQRKRITCVSAASTPLGTVTISDVYASERSAWVFTTAGQWAEWEWTSTGWKIVDVGQYGSEVLTTGQTANPLCLVHKVAIADTVDFLQPVAEFAGQRSIWLATANSGTPVGTVSGLFYLANGAATGVDVNFNAAGDSCVLEWVDSRWYAANLVSATVS